MCSTRNQIGPKNVICEYPTKHHVCIMRYGSIQALHDYNKYYYDAKHIQIKQMWCFMCGDYIVQAEKHIVSPNQRYL